MYAGVIDRVRNREHKKEVAKAESTKKEAARNEKLANEAPSNLLDQHIKLCLKDSLERLGIPTEADTGMDDVDLDAGAEVYGAREQRWSAQQAMKMACPELAILAAIEWQFGFTLVWQRVGPGDWRATLFLRSCGKGSRLAQFMIWPGNLQKPRDGLKRTSLNTHGDWYLPGSAQDTARG